MQNSLQAIWHGQRVIPFEPFAFMKRRDCSNPQRCERVVIVATPKMIWRNYGSFLICVNWGFPWARYAPFWSCAPGAAPQLSLETKFKIFSSSKLNKHNNGWRDCVE